MTELTTYDRLKARFDQTFRDTRGGVDIEYLTGEQVTSRLNDVLGVSAWSFKVLEHNINAEADEAWVLGELTAVIDGLTVTRQQFGSQKLKRSRSTGVPLDIGFDLKGAATDAMKKCATLIGVGLYLSEKHAGANGKAQSSAPARQQPQRPKQPSQQQRPAQAQAAQPQRFACSTCNAVLTQTTLADGRELSVQQLADFGKAKYGKVLCADHCRSAADEARKAAETR